MSDELNLDELEQLAQNWTLSREQSLKLIDLARKGLTFEESIARGDIYEREAFKRAEALENDAREISSAYRVQRARAQRYEKALEFYGDESNHDLLYQKTKSHVSIDRGAKAREALEEKP